MMIALGYETIPGVADSDFIDRLAERIYAIDQLVDPLLFLNSDGSVSATFEVEASDPVEAVEKAARLFFDAFLEATPLRVPTTPELQGAQSLERAVAEQLAGQFVASVNASSAHRPTPERERVPA